LPNAYLDLARWISVALLLVVVSGWRPRLTAIPHWWIAYSLHSSARTVDGGDQVAAVLTLLLLPVALLDSRRWHWQRGPSSDSRDLITRLVACSALLAIRLQVAGIYFHAAVAKLKVEEWVDGTAMCYWLTNPYIGAPHYLSSLLKPLVQSGIVAFLTWGVLGLELALAAGLVVSARYRPALLALGLAFHAAIALVLGIGSFALAMMAALILYLWPTHRELRSSLPGLLRHQIHEAIGGHYGLVPHARTLPRYGGLSQNRPQLDSDGGEQNP
jgi:antimicrobial peptide system SdpB family protein